MTELPATQTEYSLKKFLEDYQRYREKTGKEVEDLYPQEFFVTWCRNCGRENVTRSNILYSVFKNFGQPLCFRCQKKNFISIF